MTAEEFIPKNEHGMYSRNEIVTWAEKYAQSKLYSEKDLKQFGFECVAKFLSNDDNKIEMKLVEVISDRLDTHFENFKKK